MVGCGAIGAGSSTNEKTVGTLSHAEAYAKSLRTELVGVFDPSALARDTAKSAWGLPTSYSDLKMMLKATEAEVVSICGPDETHEEAIRISLEHSSVRAILAEKPLALSPDAAQKIVTACDAAGVLLTVNYSRRFCPAFIRLKESIATGGLGKIQAINGFYTKGLVHNGTHWIDLLRYLIGEVRSVRGFRGAPDGAWGASLHGILELVEPNVTAALMAADADALTIFEMQIVGSKACVRIADSGHLIKHYPIEDNPHYPGHRSFSRRALVEEDCLKDAISYAVKAVCEDLDSPREPRICSGEEGLRALRISNAIETSRHGGGSEILL